MSLTPCQLLLHVVTCPLWTWSGLPYGAWHTPAKIYSDHDQALYNSDSIGTGMQ